MNSSFAPIPALYSHPHHDPGSSAKPEPDCAAGALPRSAPGLLAKRLASITLAVFLAAGSIKAPAGWTHQTRSSCKSWAKKYVANAHVGCGALLLQVNRSSGCGYVSAHAGRKQCVVGHAEAWANNGPSGTSGWGDRSGTGWVGPSGAANGGADSYSSNRLDSFVEFDPAASQVLLRLTEGVLLAANDESFSQFEVRVWREDFEGQQADVPAAIRDDQVVWAGSVRVQGGVVRYSDNFPAQDFQVADVPLPSGLAGTQVTVSNVVKVIPFAPADADRIVVSVFGDSGFGDVGTEPLPLPCVETNCITFDDGSLNGFSGLLPCQNTSPGVALSVNAPGPSGLGGDHYLHARDLSGPSVIQNFAAFRGDWTCLASNGCAEFCFDLRLFIDGSQQNLSITPAFVLLSDPDGPCGATPPIRAQFVANFAITEDAGTNGGWHHLCAPVKLLENGVMPSNSYGGWRMLDGRPDSDWPVLLSAVTGVQFPIDFTSNPAEEVGYDNFCFHLEDCAPKCLVVTNETVTCLTNGTYAYTFSVTNQSLAPISWLGLLDLPAGLSVNGQATGDLVWIDPPLPIGGGTNVTVTLNYTGAVPATLCFMLTAHDRNLEACCSVAHCVTLPDCCALITDECLIALTNAPGDYLYTFNYLNLSGLPVEYLLIVPDAGSQGCLTPLVVVLTPPLPAGAATNLSVILNLAAGCGPKLCFIISAHDALLEECCEVHRCLTLPSCCQGKTYTLDKDFELGTLVNLNHTPSDQLQINAVAKPFPYVNIACSGRGTAVRIDVNSGVVLGEYLTSPDNMGRNPSRTTVDKFGNVWVANRNEASESPSGSGNYKGSVVRIGLILGGTRGKKDSFGNFVPDPTGAYLSPPFIYNTCVDRDGDGLIKTSKGLGDVLPWPNTAGVDSDGGVTTAEDECITIYTRVAGTGTRFIGIDCNNNVWTGGLNDRDFEMLDGFTGLPVPGFAFNIGCGGYGGLIDGYGTLWSANQIMRFVPNISTPPGAGTCLSNSCYGLGLDPRNCHVFGSSCYSIDAAQNYQFTGLTEFDSAGNVVNNYPAINGGGGLCVDAFGHVWVAQYNQIAHLKPVGTGHVLVGYIGGFQGAWGVAVDSNGKIWAAEMTGDRAARIDPALAGGLGAVDLVVPLGTNAFPYNYSDMTGFVELSATCRSGFWTIVHDGCSEGQPWGLLSWSSTEPPGTGIKVEVRAADAQAGLAALPFVPVKNGASFCGSGLKGRYLEVRVNFIGESCSTNSPILYDLTIECCPQRSSCGPTNHLPRVAKCPEPITLCDASGPTPVTVNVMVTDADGDPLTVTWREGNNTPFDTDLVPAGGPPTVGLVGFTQTFSVGTHVVIMAIDDGSGRRDVCDVIINVGDTTPPGIECPPGVSVVAFEGSVPNFTSVFVSDDCTPTGGIKVEQTPLPGTVVGVGTHPVLVIATDQAGNSRTCQTFYAVSPKVKIVKPAKYAMFDPPATIDVEASVEIAPDQVAEVRFYEGTRLVGTAARPPYRAAITELPVGSYILVALALDKAGHVAASDHVPVSVGKGQGAPAPLRLPIPVRSKDAVSLALPTEAGVTYTLECSDSLSPPTWKTHETILGDGSTMIISDVLTNSHCRFYRVRVESR
ncbi:MAG: HYR domain-containing protein [Verrucomicrobia bacterium]|nr:HYR domain-containing protein [Verrucomicrobiota bacterium]